MNSLRNEKKKKRKYNPNHQFRIPLLSEVQKKKQLCTACGRPRKHILLRSHIWRTFWHEMKHLSVKRSRPCYSEYHLFHLGLLYSDFISFYHLKYPQVCSELGGLAEENVIFHFDGFADNLAQKNISLLHYLLFNPAYDLIVQMSLQGTILYLILSHISRVSSIDQQVLHAIV